MKRGVLIIVLIIGLIVGFILGAFIPEREKVNMSTDWTGAESIIVNVQREELGSTIIQGSDCLSYAKDKWKNFTFTISEDTAECKITYVGINPSQSPIELHCGCIPKK